MQGCKIIAFVNKHQTKESDLLMGKRGLKLFWNVAMKLNNENTFVPHCLRRVPVTFWSLLSKENIDTFCPSYRLHKEK